MKIWIAVLAIAAGCSKDNPYFCAGNPDDNCALDGGTDGDAPKACTSNDDCTGALGVCDTANSVCVACTSSDIGSCTGATPVCSTTNACRGCAANSECSSGACMPDGSCADASTLLYVTPTGADPACSVAAPCSIFQAIGAATTGRNTIVLAEGAYMTGTVIVDKEITLLGRDAKFTKNVGQDGPVFKITATGKGSFLYMTIESGDGASVGHGLQCEAGGALAARFVTVELNASQGIRADACTVQIDRSTIRQNPSGGINITGTSDPFTITNNFVYSNGNTSTATFGGVKLDLTSFATSRFDFNTVVENTAINNSLYTGGVYCVGSSFMPANNIIASNYLGTSSSAGTAQTVGDCNHQTSLIQADVTDIAFVDGVGPDFDLRIGSASTAKDMATTASPVSVDHEGDPRPDGAKDIGADEYK